MREALGLRTDGSRIPQASGHRPDRQADHGGTSNPRRHRFVQEGEIPVEVMALRDHASRVNGAFARHRGDDAALAAERLAREQAERAVAELSERLREVQTKLGHAELARNEALALAAERLAQIEALRALPPPPPVIVHVPAAPVVRKAASPKPITATPKPRGRQKAPKPVKWWIKASPVTD